MQYTCLQKQTGVLENATSHRFAAGNDLKGARGIRGDRVATMLLGRRYHARMKPTAALVCDRPWPLARAGQWRRN